MISNKVAAARLDVMATSVGLNVHDAHDYRLAMNEEPITEDLLLRIRREVPGVSHVHSFTKHEERQNGADWEMYVRVAANSCLEFRVQAKRARSDGFDLGYPNRGRYTNRQIKNLIEVSLRDGLIPAYMLYSDRTVESFRACGGCNQKRELAAPPYSIALLPGWTALELLITGRTSESAVLARSVPLSCLIRCLGKPDTRTSGPPGIQDLPATARGMAPARRRHYARSLVRYHLARVSRSAPTRWQTWLRELQIDSSDLNIERVMTLRFQQEEYDPTSDHLPSTVSILTDNPTDGQVADVLSSRGVRGLAILEVDARLVYGDAE